ncbi:polyketide synthase dehydratase domain-containing protein, partial [Parafrankia discariae]|uniref:polyketide synthase dehydratase domain-containing protein n=1 Tax=Parafrankia discariae TaxID=365528 RepID=UPI0018A88317
LAGERGWRSSRLAVSHAFHSVLMEPMLAEFAVVVDGLVLREPDRTVVSTVSGVPVEPGRWTDPGYWVEQVRRPVRFADAVTAMAGQGVTRIIELGPDAILTAMIQSAADGPAENTASGAGENTPTGAGAGAGELAGVLAVPALRRERDEAATLLSAVGRLFVDGADVDWAAVFAGTGGGRVDLPTYAFQRLHLWPRLRVLTGGDPAGVGQVATAHPLLGAALTRADGDGTLLTGRLAVADQPWLADHRVLGQVVVPGAALLEIVLAAGERVGAPVVDELLLAAPLVLPERGGVRVQVTVTAAEADGRRALTVYSQGEDGDDEPWTVHATATLAPDSHPATADAGLVVWPPQGADELPLDGVYDVLAEAGLGYGPAFQGLRRVWRRAGEVFAEVTVDDPIEGFGLHPALLDAALQAIGVGGLLPAGGVRLPFAFSEVRHFGTAGATLRVRIDLADGADTARLAIADGSGLPIARIERLALRPVAADQLSATTATRLLYAVDWVPAPEPARTAAGAEVAGGEAEGWV